jgi:hypothetical protein
MPKKALWEQAVIIYEAQQASLRGIGQVTDTRHPEADMIVEWQTCPKVPTVLTSRSKC